jgi:hypothetical protein
MKLPWAVAGLLLCLGAAVAIAQNAAPRNPSDPIPPKVTKSGQAGSEASDPKGKPAARTLDGKSDTAATNRSGPEKSDAKRAKDQPVAGKAVSKNPPDVSKLDRKRTVVPGSTVKPRTGTLEPLEKVAPPSSSERLPGSASTTTTPNKASGKAGAFSKRMPGGTIVPGTGGFTKKLPNEGKPVISPGLLENDQGGKQFKDVETAETGDSFRIATFNTHLISPIFNKAIFDSDHADADAQVVASAIAFDAQNLHSFDVIALNEVWDEDAKKIIVKTLAPIFPYYLQKLEASFPTLSAIEIAEVFGVSVAVPTPKLEDSGLMLFSKVPFQQFRIRNSAQWVKHAFHCFNACSGIDAAASKGIGLVALKKPNSSRHYLVGFTHLQDGDAAVRASQMAEIAGLIKHVRQKNPEIVRGDTFVMGDLNIDGFSPPALAADLNPLTWKATDPAQAEWAQFFWNDKQSYFVNPLYDAWAWTTSPFDPGYTSPGGTRRLDYIIHDHEPGHVASAVQHIHHVLVGKTDSDHVAVAADLNHPSPFCLPRLARRLGLEKLFAKDAWDSVPIAGELKYPGSMQWYRFDRLGTYSIGLPQSLYDAGLRVTVYQKNDLSTPIAIYNKETTIKTVGVGLGASLLDVLPPEPYVIGKYHMGEPPIYIRVSNPGNRAWYGKYKIFIHRHRGASMEDAITLVPGEAALDPGMPTDKPLNTTDTVWFELVTDKAHSGKPQHIEYYVDNPPTQPLTLNLLDETGAGTLAASKTPNPIKQDDVGGKKLYLTLTRNDYTQSGFSVGWRTNLTWLVGMSLPGATWPFKLVCTDETGSDWAGSDEIWSHIYVDGALYSLEYFSDVDTDDHYSMEGMLKPVAFLESVTVQLQEVDDSSADDWSNVAVINPLDPATAKAMTRWVDLLPDGGNYEFRFNLSHSLNK